MSMRRIVQAGDFQRVLAAPVRERSAHFAVHYLKAAPLASKPPAAGATRDVLSTVAPPSCPQTVDDLSTGPWFGWVIPKRHARRSVTRNLLRRQMRAAVERVQAELPSGLWVLRLRQGFALREFPSAASTALRVASRQELDTLMRRATRARP